MNALARALSQQYRAHLRAWAVRKLLGRQEAYWLETAVGRLTYKGTDGEPEEPERVPTCASGVLAVFFMNYTRRK